MCVVIIKLPWVDFQVVVAGYCVNLNFLLWGGLETKNKTKARCNLTFKQVDWVHELWEERCIWSDSHHNSLVLYAKLLHPSSVQLPQQTHDASLLACAGWTVHQQVWEVATLNLKQTFREALLWKKSMSAPALLDNMVLSFVVSLFTPASHNEEKSIVI